jgi:hypothetical protein
LVVVVRVKVCPTVIPESIWAEPGFGIKKLDVVCVYPYSNMLVVVCCGIPKVEVEPSMVARL